MQDDAATKAQKQKVQIDKPEVAETSVEAVTTKPEPEGTTTNSSTTAPSKYEAKTTEASQEQEPSADTPSTQETTHFYLHKPHTSSTNTVLVPLASSTTLTIALHQQHVLEFPTIYAFTTIDTSESTNPLPNGFITVQQYTQNITEDDKELEGLMSSMPKEQRKIALDGGIFSAPEEKREEVGEKEIAEMLQRDADASKQ